jgi:PDZ domain-containing secreted protein
MGKYKGSGLILHQAYKKYGIETTGVIIIESLNTSDLKCGDKVTHVNGTRIGSADDMNIIFKSCKVGDVVRVTVERSESKVEVELTLTEKVPDSVNFG